MTLRRRYEGSFDLPWSPDRAFPKFTALGEKEWVPGWDPELVYPTSGELQMDQVFRTGEGDELTLWYVSRLDPEAYEVDYIRATPGSRVARVSVAVQGRNDGSRVTVSYCWTALGEAGRREIEAAGADYAHMMTEWRRLLLAAGRG